MVGFGGTGALSAQTQALKFQVQSTSVEWADMQPDVAMAHVHIRIKLDNMGASRVILSKILLPRTRKSSYRNDRPER